MSYFDELLSRSEAFSRDKFVAGLKMLPSRKTIIIGCVDPRVDPADVFGLAAGEAVVIRNVGGRITPDALEIVEVLGAVANSAGQQIGEGWNLIVLHHTNCGIVNCLHHAPDILARNLGVGIADLDRMAIDDPYKAVALDIAALQANPRLPQGVTFSGLVYDVANGHTQTVVAPPLALSA